MALFDRAPDVYLTKSQAARKAADEAILMDAELAPRSLCHAVVPGLEAVMGQTDSKKKLGHFELQVSKVDQDVAYLRLPNHPGETCKMSKSIKLAELIGSYAGPEVVLDFDQDGVLVGIEILA